MSARALWPLAWLAAAPLAATPYLAGVGAPDGLVLLPPPPARDSATEQRDRRIYLATRGLRGSARWRIATDDVTNRPLDRFACAINLRLTPTSAPALARLIDGIGTGETVDPVKARYAVPRPFVTLGGPICQPATAHLATNGDYPSGHAANGWLEGLVLAELLPARASAILARARAYGESRAVCGAHSLSAVEAGWLAGSATFATLQADPEFRRGLDAARRELATRIPTRPRPDAATCAAERAALAARPW